jgi:hypothetical protein
MTVEVIVIASLPTGGVAIPFLDCFVASLLAMTAWGDCHCEPPKGRRGNLAFRKEKEMHCSLQTKGYPARLDLTFFRKREIWETSPFVLRNEEKKERKEEG